MVRLEAASPWGFIGGSPPGFNSRLVRLEERHVRRDEGVSAKFQFQVGSTRREKARLEVQPVIRSFNSRLVRLEVYLYLRRPVSDARFNSRLVRLEVARYLVGAVLSGLFQFQVGSTRSRQFSIKS